MVRPPVLEKGRLQCCPAGKMGGTISLVSYWCTTEEKSTGKEDVLYSCPFSIKQIKIHYRGKET